MKLLTQFKGTLVAIEEKSMTGSNNKYLDGLNDLIEKALKSKNFEADHKRIEIVVKW